MEIVRRDESDSERRTGGARAQVHVQTEQQGTERTERTEEGGRERGATTMNAATTTFGDDHDRDILLMVLHFACRDCPFRVPFLVLAKTKCGKRKKGYFRSFGESFKS